MLVNSKGTVNLQLNRKGGAIITGRVDVWIANNAGWDLKESLIYQDVANSAEQKQVKLKKGNYSVVIVCRVEESINGAFALEVLANGTVVANKDGDVDTTSNPHDAKTFKSQFVLNIN